MLFIVESDHIYQIRENYICRIVEIGEVVKSTEEKCTHRRFIRTIIFGEIIYVGMIFKGVFSLDLCFCDA